MKLGLALPWNGARVELPVARVQLAERLGFDSVGSAEAYGSDAITPSPTWRRSRRASASARR